MDKSLEKLPDDCVFEQVSSPIGDLMVVGNNSGVHAILWKGQDKKPENRKRLRRLEKARRGSPANKACQQLKDYFAGKRTTFDIPVVFGGTVFQNKAWRQLQKIPFGKTVSYQQQAARVGGKEKARAVGMANGKNPIPIIVPCHRVIGKDGSLTGFGGGLKTKRFLLDLESHGTNRES